LRVFFHCFNLHSPQQGYTVGEAAMKRLLLAGLICLGSMDALAGDDRRDAVIGGALGGAAGAVIGQQVGGATGAAIGGALGGALGAGLAVDDHDHDQRAYHGGYAAPVAYYPRHARPVMASRPVAYYPTYARPVVVTRPVVVHPGYHHPVAGHVGHHYVNGHGRKHHRHHDH
jgi:hypothetical protein